MLNPNYIVIIHFGNINQTRRCVQSIKVFIKNCKIIIVNNNRKNLDFKENNIFCIDNNQNLGFSTGNNIGIKYCLNKGANEILLLNNDTYLDQDPIPNLKRILYRNNSIGIVGPKILTEDKKIWFAGGYLDKNRYTSGHYGFDIKRPEQKNNSINFITGCAMLIKREVFEKIGFFDDKFFMYYEDVDFCVRALKKGFILKYVPDVTVYHDVNNKKIDLSEYYKVRNHFLFVEKQAPIYVKLRELIRFPKTLIEISQTHNKLKKHQYRAVIDYLRRRFGPYDNWS